MPGIGQSAGKPSTDPIQKRPYRKHGKDQSHPDFPHGLYAGWKAKCRCDPCIAAYRGYHRRHILGLRERNPEYLNRDRIYKISWRRTPKGRAVCANGKIRYMKAKNAVEHNELLNAIYMACPAGYQVDHILPLSKGGPHHPNNLQYLPALLNNKKNARLDFDCGDAALDWRNYVEGTFNDHPDREYGQAAGKSGGPETAQNMV